MMNANNKSQSLSGGLIRTILLLFLSYQFSCDTNTNGPYSVDAAYFDFKQLNNIDSCKDYGIESKDTLELLQEECLSYCGRNTMEAFDYADVDEDPTYVIRNTVCRCFENGLSPMDPKTQSFECWSKAEVWDKQKPLMKCEDDYGIISLSTCRDYCKRIDPQAYSYMGFSGSSLCECGGFEVCNDNPVVSTATTCATTVSTALTLMVGCILALGS